MKPSRVNCLVGWGITLCLLVSLGGCMTTDAQKGAVGGAGVGALAGQLIGRDTGSTLIGAGVGMGLGYIIGSESDKKKAAQANRSTQPANYSHNEVAPLGGTRWKVVSLNPKSSVPPYVSKIVEFKPNGIMVTTTTNPDGTVDVDNEHYRVVGNTLVMNGHGYLINARYGIRGNRLAVDADDFNVVLRRI